MAARAEFVNPQWPSGYTPASHYARSWYSSESIPVLAALSQLTARRILAFASPIRGNWLEIGCGPGVFLPSVHRAASSVVGIDMNHVVIRDAGALTQSMCGASLAIQGSAYSMPFRDRSFDGVLALETLEHLDGARVMTEVTRVLKPMGKLVFSVPVEVGSALLVRQTIRRILHWRDPGFAPMAYPVRDLVGMVLGDDIRLHREKRRATSDEGHMYFSYRALLEDVGKKMSVRQVSWSPLSIPGPWTFNLLGLAVNDKVN